MSVSKEVNQSSSHLLISSEQLYEAFPTVMKHLPGPHNRMFSNFNTILDFISEEVKSHKRDVDHNNPRDYIDAFIIEMENVCEQLHCTHCIVSPSLSISLPFTTVSSAFLNSTKRLTWASLRPTWLCALWICSWLERRRPPQLCCGLWFSSSNTLISRVGGMLCFFK